MSWQTQFARRVFPKEQPFMARRKLIYLVWAVIVGVLASGIVLAITLFVNSQNQ